MLCCNHAAGQDPIQRQQLYDQSKQINNLEKKVIHLDHENKMLRQKVEKFEKFEKYEMLLKRLLEEQDRELQKD